MLDADAADTTQRRPRRRRTPRSVELAQIAATRNDILYIEWEKLLAMIAQSPLSIIEHANFFRESLNDLASFSAFRLEIYQRYGTVPILATAVRETRVGSMRPSLCQCPLEEACTCVLSETTRQLLIGMCILLHELQQTAFMQCNRDEAFRLWFADTSVQPSEPVKALMQQCIGDEIVRQQQFNHRSPS